MVVIIMAATVLLPVVALADDYEEITVTGNWEVEYEVDDFSVGSSGGTGVLRLKVKNTAASASTDIINYVSISYATGRDSASHQTKSVTIAPTRDRIMEFSIPIAASDAGLGLQLWVAMSTGDADDVDGIGVENGVMFGPPATYNATFDLNTSSRTINQGESIRINFSGVNTGNKPVDIKVFDQTGAQVFTADNMDILYIGHANYTPEHTTTYRFRAEVYRLGTDRLEKEVISSSITITVIEPTPEPTATPTPEPAAEPEADPTPEPTETPVEVPTATPALEVEAEVEVQEEAMSSEEENDEQLIVVGAGNADIGSSASDNMLQTVIIALLVLIAVLVAALMVYMLKAKKSAK